MKMTNQLFWKQMISIQYLKILMIYKFQILIHFTIILKITTQVDFKVATEGQFQRFQSHFGIYTIFQGTSSIIQTTPLKGGTDDLTGSWIQPILDFGVFGAIFKLEQSHLDGEIPQLATGLVPKPKRIKTQRTASRVLRISESPTNGNIRKLKAIAHTCML